MCAISGINQCLPLPVSTPITTLFYILCSILLISDNNHARAEVFTSMADVQNLIDSERRVVSILNLLVKAEKEKIAAVEDYVKQFSDIYDQPEADALKLVSHPVNAFLLVKHLSVDWNNLKRFLAYDLAAAAITDSEAQRVAARFPEEEDVKGAAEGIVRLQKTYLIDTESFAGGNISGISKAPALRAVDCYLIGHRLALEEVYDYAISWLEIALRKFDEEQDPSPKVRKVDILDWLQYSYYHYGNPLRSLELSERVQKLDAGFPTVEANIRFYTDILKTLGEDAIAVLEQQPRPPAVDNQGGSYEALCRGEGEVSPHVRPHLRCFYETHGNPFLLIQPAKFEVAHVNPYIYILHDVALPSQLENIKAIAMNYLQRATVVKPGSTDTEAAKIRISKSAFLEEHIDPVIAAVNAYIGHITNLDMNQAEALQVANYGIGGHYNAHFDFFRNPNDLDTKQIDPNQGDRIATLLVYMTDVEAGGATTFPAINLTLFPQKGSAAFWWNLHKDGVGDTRTLHEGCPVLSGNKWVSNKWIREVGQFFSRPCDLVADSRVVSSVAKE